MNHIYALILKLAEAPSVELAFFSGGLNQEIAAIGAVLVTIAGMGLCWQAPRYRMSMEERVKDGALTSEQAQRKIQFMERLAPAVAFAGCALLAFLVLR